MKSKTVWDEIQDLMTAVQHYLPKYSSNFTHFLIGDFMCCRGDFGPTGVVLLKENNDNFFTRVCWMGSHIGLETQFENQKRRIMITSDMIFSQPLIWRDKNTVYPVFHEHWKRGKNGKGALVFLNAAPTRNDCAYYAKEGKWKATKEGNLEVCAKLPDSIAGLIEVLGHAIPWSIDFEAKAREILERSLLREFAEACKKIRVIN